MAQPTRTTARIKPGMDHTEYESSPLPRLVPKSRPVSPYTSLAITAFQRVAAREASLRRAEDELAHWSPMIPPEDMEEYNRVTADIQTRYDQE